MVSSREEPVRELTGKGLKGKITSSSSAGVGEVAALRRLKYSGRQHPSQGFAKGHGGVKGNSP